MDIEADIINSITAILNSHNIRYSRQGPLFNVLVDYLSYSNKWISIRKRNVYISKEIKSKISSFPKATEFITLIHAVIGGQDINPYQSDTLRQLKFHDHLLNNWHIHHLHLSLEDNTKNNYFKKRTDHLVFAHIKEDDIFFLDFAKHSPGIFADEQWLRIINNNWSWILSKYRDNKVTQYWPILTPQERQIFWNKGYMLGMTTVDNENFINPGIGSMVSGHNALVIQEAQNVLYRSYKIKEWYEENELEIKNELAKKCCIRLEDIILKARITKKKIEIYEHTTNYSVGMY